MCLVPLDDAANFAIAQGIRGELRGFDAVTQGLASAKGIGEVAVAGTTGVSNLLQDVRSTLTQLSNDGITSQQRTILSNDFNELLSQAANFLANSSFNGVNLIDSGGTSINTLSNLTGGTLTLTAVNLRTRVTSLAAAGVTSSSAGSVGDQR